MVSFWRHCTHVKPMGTEKEPFHSKLDTKVFFYAKTLKLLCNRVLGIRIKCSNPSLKIG